MTLPNVYLQVYGQIPEFFAKIQDGQAPDKFTQQHLKDLGFTSANHRGFIPLLKALGFLTPDGIPTPRYHTYRDRSQASAVMAEALREVYADLFVIKANPTEVDSALIEGKFKSAHNAKDRPAELMTKTFFSLLKLADLSSQQKHKDEAAKKPKEKETQVESKIEDKERRITPPGLHYNIQIHLPATKDIEVYNAIFKSLKEQLIG